MSEVVQAGAAELPADAGTIAATGAAHFASRLVKLARALVPPMQEELG